MDQIGDSEQQNDLIVDTTHEQDEEEQDNGEDGRAGVAPRG